MLGITQELRHFEAVFFEASDPGTFRARIFSLSEELPFAGHPLIGGAAVLHQKSRVSGPQEWQFALRDKTVTVTTSRTPEGYYGRIDQGTPAISPPLPRRDAILAAFALTRDDHHPQLPMQVVSTGLRYLIVPVVPGALARARIREDITPLLRDVGAQFAVLLDERALEVRHWNNDGIVEDIATGSAAGTIGAYRLTHGLAAAGETFVLNQGQYTGRASTLHVQPEGSRESVTTVKVGGDVAFVGTGSLEVLP
jgi:PhzF family phenazine biosynthesis protein